MKKTVSIILTIILCLIMILPNYIYANNNITTSDYKDIYKKQGQDVTSLLGVGGSILSVVQIIGIAAGVICLLILGIKYMMMSSNADDKAKIKEKLVPYLIGAILLFGGSGILSLIAKFAQKLG